MLVTGIVLALAAAVAAEDCFVPSELRSHRICINENGTLTTSLIPEADRAPPSAYVDMDTMWNLLTGSMVFFMQAGFTMLTAGCVSTKNVQNILYQNVMVGCIGAIAFWFLGYGFAFGGANDNPFIGQANFGMDSFTNDNNQHRSWFFQYCFVETGATIVAGSVAERTKMSGYFIYAFVISAFIYPVVAHWVWDNEGWLSAFGAGKDKLFYGGQGSNGMIDFAGCGVVHMVGGFSGLVGAIAVGPRVGRFTERGEAYYVPHNMLVSTLGVVILWFGWYGFNPGSTLAIVGYSKVSAKVAVTTSISAATGALTSTFFSKAMTGKYDLMVTLNGLLAGLVAITAACPVVEPWGAFIIGFVGAFVYMGLSKLIKRLQIDDPLDAFPIHGGCGMWGLLVCGIPGIVSDKSVGWVYGTDNDAVLRGEQFAVQLVGLICIMLWTVVTSSIMFFGIKYTIGLRVLPEIEQAGLDISEHGGIAFFDAPAKITDLELGVVEKAAAKTAALEEDLKASVQV